MSSIDLLRRLFRYQAWAHEEFLQAMAGLDPDRHGEALRSALRLIHHCHVVGQIFAAHLQGQPHGYASDSPPDTPGLADLRTAVAAGDRWYLDYLDRATPELLSEAVPFTFTDGDHGTMTREEMLAHVITHGGYHRGEVGRILARLGPVTGFSLPWDTYAVHLHRTEPSRRLHAAA